MAKQYKLIITDGEAAANIKKDTYSVTASVTGYDNSSIDPNSLTVTDETNYELKISATGTLTLHVTEEGTEGGKAIVGATFKRCDKNGNEYGDLITTDENGNAVFQYVPFASTSAPNIYYKQLTSDDAHEFDSTLKTETLTDSTKTVEVQNPLSTLKTVKLTDANYSNLPIETGEINLG